jgi:hypothetical protein
MRNDPILLANPTIKYDLCDMSYIRNDTNWLADSTCFKINIDTIDVSLISKSTVSKDQFEYRNRQYYKTQLFDLSEYDNIRTFQIRGFSITQNVDIEPMIIKSESNCLNDEQIARIHDIYNGHGIKPPCIWDNCPVEIYFCDIIAKNNSQKELKFMDKSYLISNH